MLGPFLVVIRSRQRVLPRREHGQEQRPFEDLVPTAGGMITLESRSPTATSPVPVRHTIRMVRQIRSPHLRQHPRGGPDADCYRMPLPNSQEPEKRMRRAQHRYSLPTECGEDRGRPPLPRSRCLLAQQCLDTAFAGIPQRFRCRVLRHQCQHGRMIQIGTDHGFQPGVDLRKQTQVSWWCGSVPKLRSLLLPGSIRQSHLCIVRKHGPTSAQSGAAIAVSIAFCT